MMGKSDDGKIGIFQRRNGRTNEERSVFAKDDDSTLPKEPNGSKIGLGPKPIWGMSAYMSFVEASAESWYGLVSRIKAPADAPETPVPIRA